MLHDDRSREDGTIGFAKDLREILQKDQLATLGEVTTPGIADLFVATMQEAS